MLLLLTREENLTSCPSLHTSSLFLQLIVRALESIPFRKRNREESLLTTLGMHACMQICRNKLLRDIYSTVQSSQEKDLVLIEQS